MPDGGNPFSGAFNYQFGGGNSAPSLIPGLAPYGSAFAVSPGGGAYLGFSPSNPPAWLAVKEPSSFLDFTEDVQCVLTNPYTLVVDPLVSLSLSVAPNGSGELTLSNLTVDSTGFLVTWWEANGVPGRTYVLNLQGTTQAGRIYQWLFYQLCDPLFAVTAPDFPANPGFGTPITWIAPAGGVPFGLLGGDSDQLLGGDGSPLQFSH